MMTEQLGFHFGDATEYMANMLVFEERRDELNSEINAARAAARELGVPTKAVELALRQARNKIKALELVKQEAYDHLVAHAHAMIAVEGAMSGTPDLEDTHGTK